jgi:hypothetical protein
MLSKRIESMRQQYTVYFDTSFYVKLCRADEALAGQTIHALNLHPVSYVDVSARRSSTSKKKGQWAAKKPLRLALVKRNSTIIAIIS